MRILFLDQFSDVGGAQLCLLDLVRELRKAEFDLHIAVPGNGPLIERLRQAGTRCYSLNLHRYSLGPKNWGDGIHFLADLRPLARRIRDLVAEVNPDVVYANGPRLMPAVALAGLPAPVVFHSHNVLASRASRLLVARSIERSNASVIAASRFAAAQWRQAYVVYGGVRGPASEPPARNSTTVGMIGRMSPQKGQREFVMAARAVEAQFVLCGDAALGDEQYRDHVLQLAPPSLRWVGWRDDVYPVLAELDLLVLPSCDEGGFPRVLMEAFAAGVPVLALASGAVPEIAVEGRNAFLLASREPPEIARRVRELLADRPLLASVAAEARRLWHERFTVERYARDIREVLRIGGRGCATQRGTSYRAVSEP
jgi:glycosyltransferase involved in cell wall biosynthesis